MFSTHFLVQFDFDSEEVGTVKDVDQLKCIKKCLFFSTLLPSIVLLWTITLLLHNGPISCFSAKDIVQDHRGRGQSHATHTSFCSGPPHLVSFMLQCAAQGSAVLYVYNKGSWYNEGHCNQS